jgi:alpha-L-arabinofuranosidase
MNTPNKIFPFLALIVLAAAGRNDLHAADAMPTLEIHAEQATAKVSPMFYGLMTEEINFSYEGGLYGELIRNRSFKADAVNTSIKSDAYDPAKYYPVQIAVSNTPKFWRAVGGAVMLLDTNMPLNEALNVSLKLDASAASKESPAGIANGGYWGIPVQPRTTYRVSFYAKAASGFAGPLMVSLESADGKTQFASAKVSGLNGEWQKFQAKLTTKRVAPSKDNVFKITTTAPGTLWLQQVSMFPPAYHNRPNGNRSDIMELLAGMHPKFLRLPGGNYVEGNSFNQHFNWKETIGPVEQRPGHASCWGYWSTDGFGLLEYAEWCEDLKMEPVLAVFAGYALRRDYVEAGPKLEPYVQEALDEIEYLTGDAAATKWGARRAKDGHPAPFPLRYVEVGNEDFFDRSGSYEGRFAQFYDAVKAKYPQLQVIATTPVKSRVADLIDEHYYRNQQEMEAQSRMYDTRSRTNHTKVFVGEWATRVGSPTPNMAGALGDAAWLCGMERNADLVVMECFAPLFVNVSQLTGPGRSMQWESDLIGYDALTSYGSPSYYVEKMFGQDHGDVILPVKSDGIPTVEQVPPAGRRGGTPAPRQVPGLYYSATRDTAKGTIYLKVVNVAAAPQPVSVSITGVASVARTGEAVVLAADNPLETNSIQDPLKLAPVTTKITGLGTSFTRTLPKFSVTVFKLQSRSRRSSAPAAPVAAVNQAEPGSIAPPPTTAPTPAITAVAPTASAPAAVRPAPPVRIKAGKSEPVKDTEGNVWLADQGFTGGETLERPDIQIANTKNPDLYRAERYSMESFSWPVPNGKYVVKLHFAETFEGITGPGERVFSFSVQGHEFKNFDVWAKAGGPLRAYVETVNVEATNGVIKVTFTPKVENPQINGIEILPQP